ncbi:hypothetical protein RYA05_04470 [Pseudomonas syringae pv. actinidiae]|nr:hypothetical protein [Pseudomonas syringae pv. actinidiae]
MKTINRDFHGGMYLTAKKPLLHEDQLVTLLSLLGSMESGIDSITVLERIHALEEDKPTKAAWSSAIANLKSQSSLNEVLVKTGLFSEEIQTILLIIEDTTLALKTVIKYFDTRYT